MIRNLAIALMTTASFASLARAQNTGTPPNAAPRDAHLLVDSWSKQYLHHRASMESQSAIDALRGGQTPELTLAGMLSSNEYYRQAGGTPVTYIHQLYSDLRNRAPSHSELNYWTRRLQWDTRKNVAYNVLAPHPQNWGVYEIRPEPGRYDPRWGAGVDPGYGSHYYPDPGSLNFRDPGGPYFKSPYFPNYEYRRPMRAFYIGAEG